MSLTTIIVNQKVLALLNKSEKRTASVGLRLFPSMKEALEKAAAEDHRTMASMAEKVLGDWLRANGYLPK